MKHGVPAAADVIKQVTSSTTSYIELTLADTTETCIRGVAAIVAYHASSSFANSGKASVFDGATERVVYSGDMSYTTMRYRAGVISPVSAPWAQAAVNGLNARIGYAGDVSPDPLWDAIVIEIDA